jgi:hypothetical protein
MVTTFSRRAGDGWKLPCAQIRDSLGECEVRIKVWIMGAATIPSPPTCVQRELHEVGRFGLFFCRANNFSIITCRTSFIAWSGGEANWEKRSKTIWL